MIPVASKYISMVLEDQNLGEFKVQLSACILLLLLAVGGLTAESGPKKRVLVLCTGNSARSQMAAGFLKSLDSRLDVFSAGTQPAARVNPHAIAAMKEVGIDLTGEKPKSVSQFTSQAFDYVITVCDDADKNCPNFAGKVGKRVHIGFIDPAAATGSEEHIMSEFRQVREEIRQKFSEYYKNEIGKGL
jgi:arsenate reductase